MTIPFTCPHCGTQTDVFEEYAGCSGPCAVCGKTITVPRPVGSRPVSATRAPAEPRGSRPSRRWSTWLVVAAVLVSVLIGGGVFVFGTFTLIFPAVTAGRQAALKSRTSNHLRTVVAALRSYEEDQGSLPPAFLPDQSGQPQHSWRVLILPYLGYSHVYDQYDFNQPWDSPQNMQVLRLMPAEYASAADEDARATFETSFMVVVGPRTAFPGSSAMRSSEIQDDLSQTILVAETPTFGVAWTQPVDLRADQMRFVINGRAGIEIGSRFSDGAHVGMADGGVEFLPNETPPECVQGMSTIAGRETLPWLDFP